MRVFIKSLDCLRLGHIKGCGFLAAILHQLDLITRYIYANGQKISSWTRYRYRQTGRLDGNTKEDVPLGEFFYHDNHLGSSVLITDKNGKEKTRILYKPFGEIDQSHSVGLNVTTMKFTSQEFDEETGLYYYRSRFYDPSLGRFLNPDSIIPDWYDSQSYNRYAYVRNNPLIYIDPTGHIFESPWDLVNVGIGLGSFAYNMSTGNYMDAFVDALGVGADVVATAIPGVPAGAATIIKAKRAGDKVVDAVSTTKKIANKNYRGGRHGQTKKPTNDGLDSHHTPAKDAYSHKNIHPDDGSAIQMDPFDHRRTASFGSSKDAKAYRNRQKELIDQGKWDDAIEMDIDDIQSKFGSKYDDALLEMIDGL